jgi:Anaphase-promoting complex sub unit 1 C-terminal domain
LSNSSVDAVEILVSSDRYYPVASKLRRDAEGHIFYVKRRSGHLNYKQDPDSKRSLLVQTGSFQGRDPLNLVMSFTDDQRILAFAKHFCGIAASGVSPSSAASYPFAEEGFRRRLLFESLMRDTQEALPLYLALCNAIEWIACVGRTEAFVSWDFRLIKSYYANRQLLTDDSTPRIINTEIMAHLFEMLESRFQGMSSLNFEQHPLVDNGPLSVLYEYPLYPPVMATGDTMDLS